MTMKANDIFARICSQPEIHRFFFKLGIVIAAFGVSTLMNMANFLPIENVLIQDEHTAQAEIDFYNGVAKPNIQNQLDLNVAKAKLEATNKSKTNTTQILKMHNVFIAFCPGLIAICFMLGFIFWIFNLPYVEVKKPIDKESTR